jgi:putative ABC transport system permease protein
LPVRYNSSLFPHPLMRELAQDFRLSVRTLLRQRGFTVVVLMTLAVAIGANVAIFSFVYGVLLQPLPYAEPERIVRLNETHDGHSMAISTLSYLDWKNENQVFDRFAAHTSNSVTLTGLTEPVQLRCNQVSSEFFEIFGIRAARGRTFAAGEDRPGQPLVVVMSDALWRTQFGGDPGIIGRVILLDG